jgi:hypothetical protein
MIERGQHPMRRRQMQYRYRLNYRHLGTGVVGLVALNTAAEMVAERDRLEALGYVMTDVLPPIGERPKPLPIAPPGTPAR